MNNKKITKLPASELQIMRILWNGHPEMARSEIEQALDGEKRLAPTTINTLLSRLEKKAFISAKRVGKTNYYTPLVSKKAYQRLESQTIIEQLFDGSLTNFVASLYDGKSISIDQKEDLEAFLDSLDWGQKKE